MSTTTSSARPARARDRKLDEVVKALCSMPTGSAGAARVDDEEMARVARKRDELEVSFMTRLVMWVG